MAMSQIYFCKNAVVKLGLAFFCLFFTSCSTKTDINRVFKEKYGKEIEQIKTDRKPPEIKQDNQTRRSFEIPTSENIDSFVKPKDSEPQQYYANVDEKEYAQVKPKQFFPDSNVYVEGKSTQTLPDNLFDLSYNTTLSPAFRPVKSAFDLVKIPSHDYYGVRTALDEKQYVVVGNNYLQKNVDEINFGRSKEDIEMSKELINEKRQIKRQYKMTKIFGTKTSEKKGDVKQDVESDLKKDEAKENEGKAVEKKDDPIEQKNLPTDSGDKSVNLKKSDSADAKKEDGKSVTIIDKILKIN